MRPRLLDLFCGAGGCSVGYARAGFDVTGVDLAPQPRYPHPFPLAQADSLTFPLEGFDAIHASPPCQLYSNSHKLRGNEHPDLIGPMRDRLIASGLPWVMENVEGAPLARQDDLLGGFGVELCGAMFGLTTYRHRLFETSFPIPTPPHPRHAAPTRKMGREPRPGEFMHVVGNYAGQQQARDAMGIDWMTRDEMAEAIPPAYTEWIGGHLLGALVPA